MNCSNCVGFYLLKDMSLDDKIKLYQYNECKWCGLSFEQLTDKIFIKFLKDKGVYDKFVNNLKDDDYNLSIKKWDTIETFCNDIGIPSYIDRSFKWDKSPEGHYFWEKISNKWNRVYSSLYQKKNPTSMRWGF